MDYRDTAKQDETNALPTPNPTQAPGETSDANSKAGKCPTKYGTPPYNNPTVYKVEGPAGHVKVKFCFPIIDPKGVPSDVYKNLCPKSKCQGSTEKKCNHTKHFNSQSEIKSLEYIGKCKDTPLPPSPSGSSSSGSSTSGGTSRQVNTCSMDSHPADPLHLSEVQEMIN